MPGKEHGRRFFGGMSTAAIVGTIIFFLTAKTGSLAFRPSPLFFKPGSNLGRRKSNELKVVASNSKGKPYEPKWKKKKTLAEEQGSINDLGFEATGLKGTIPVVFRQGNETKTSMAWAGQPLRDVATQAGQFIKYGCGKGDCGTCECMVNGKWVRPCVATVPATEAGNELVVQVKQVAAKSKSSGKFFSIKSFFMGFWNNLLGMFGFLRYRKAAKKNWEERLEYEELIRQKTLEKKMRRAQS